MAAWIWILIAVGIVVVVGLVIALSRQRRSTGLRQRFGAEYDRTLDAQPNRRAAESELRERTKRRASIELRPLTESSLHRYAGEWTTVQAQFVDQPTEAVRSADGLVHRVMNERGYPIDNFDQDADLISVDHPEVVDDFRSAHNVFLQAQAQQATTEDLRSAMLHYRSLFDQLLVSDASSADDSARSADNAQAVEEAPDVPRHARTDRVAAPASVEATSERPRS